MKRLPAALSDLEKRPVTVINNPGTPSEKHHKVEAHLDAYRGLFPASAPISRGDVVEYTDAVGNDTRLVAADVKIYELASPRHADVFWEGALPPRSQQAPSLGLSDLHAEVVAAAAGPFGDGSFSEAVLQGLLALEHRVSRQSGIDAMGSELMARALSGDPPPIAIAVQDGKAGETEQEGLRMLFMGVVEGIESPKRHELIHRDSPERALEQLAMVSALLHLLDHAYHRQAE